VSSLFGSEHPYSASHRDVAYVFTIELARLTGLTVYDLSLTERSVRHGFIGSTDTNLRDRVQDVDQPIIPDDVLFLRFDSDYKAQLESLQTFKPHLIYTFFPESSGRTTSEYSYCFRSDGMVEYVVAGGERIVHPLWDWMSDEFLSVRYKIMDVPTPCVLVYKKVVRKMATDRFLVFLIPYDVSYGTANFPKRFTPVVDTVRGKFVKICRQGHHAPVVSISQIESTSAVDVPRGVFDTLTTHFAGSKSVVATESIMSLTSFTREQATILRTYLMAGDVYKHTHVLPIEHAILSYQWGTFNETAKTPVRAFMSPVIHGAFVPARSRGNDERTVTKRITELQVHALDEVPSKYHGWCLDFIEEVKADLTCVSVEEVYARQNRPAQVFKLMQADNGDNTEIVSCFQKAECYSCPNDPRNISTDPAAIKIRVARFAYPIADHFKTVGWYAFGKTPLEIATLVAALAVEYQTLTISDYSRWDGRLTKFLRTCFALYTKACFTNEDQDELDFVLTSRVNRNGKTQFGVKFKTGYSQLSGGMFTSISNTFLNALNIYFAGRLSGLPHAEAYKQIGIVGGDDGCTPASAEKLEEVSKDLFLSLVAHQCTPTNGEWPMFLSRQFGPYVWKGDANSMCDLLRQLSKFHTTTNCDPTMDIKIKAREKALSYWLTDGETPFLGPLCEAIMERTSSVHSKLKQEHMSFWSLYAQEVQFPNICSEWEDDYLVRIGLHSQRREFEDWLLSTNSFEDLMKAPTVLDRSSAPPRSDSVVVSGERVVSLRLGQQKMKEVIDLALQFAAHDRMGFKTTNLVYVGAYGVDTSLYAANSLSNFSPLKLMMFDPLFLKEEGLKLHKQLRKIKNCSVHNRKFNSSQIERFPADHSMLFDDSCGPVKGVDDRLRHFLDVLGWISDWRPGKVALKVPLCAFESGGTLPGYEGVVVEMTPIEGHPITERRVLATRSQGENVLLNMETYSSAIKPSQVRALLENTELSAFT
jgi:hypothetical protein